MQDFDAPGWYPSTFFTPSILALESGNWERLVAAAGQYNPNLTTGQQRVYTDMSFDIYYHDSSDDWIAPSISNMVSSFKGNVVSIAVDTSDVSGIEAVVIAYTDGLGTWSSASLIENENTWAGGFASSADTEFFIQVVDQAGNVRVNDNNGEYFYPGDSLFTRKVYLPLVVRNHQQ
jgi:hypothetical protein